MEVSDREDTSPTGSTTTRDDSWDLAPALVAAGVDPDWLDDVATRCPTS